jgi:hypothetical protein
MSDQITPLLEQLKKNESLLQEIATTQVEALQISKKSLMTERYRVAIMGAKLLFIIILTWVGFVFLDDMVQGLMTTMGGTGGGLELGGAKDLSEQLRSSQDLMKEIMGR